MGVGSSKELHQSLQSNFIDLDLWTLSWRSEDDYQFQKYHEEYKIESLAELVGSNKLVEL